MDKPTVGFGPYLMTHRLAKQMGLDELARGTRIGEQILGWIETEDLDRLPAPVFVQGFIRSYARAVGADGDEAVRRYQQRLAVMDRQLQHPIEANPIRPCTWTRLWAATALVVAWMAVSVWLLDGTRRSEPSTAAAAVAAPRLPVMMPPAPTETATDIAQAAHRLEITALVDTWVQAAIDEDTPRQLRLQAGQKAELAARNGFVLLLGDAGAVSLRLNGKSLPAAGGSGQVKTLQLP